MTQNERILKYINDYGSISTLQAFQDIGCTRLASRICDLQKEGYVFKKEFETANNRFGEKVSYVRYSLEKEV